MMKKFLVGICVVFGFGALAQPMLFDTYGSVYIDGQITGYNDQMIFVTNHNVQGGKVAVDTIITDKDGKFVWDSAIPFKDFYLWNFQGFQPFSLILSPKDSMTLTGDVTDLVKTAKYTGSKDNELMMGYMREFILFKTAQDSLTALARGNPGQTQALNQSFMPIADRFIKYRANMIQNNPKSPAIAATLNSFNQEAEWAQYTEVVKLLNDSFHGSPTLSNINNFVKQKNTQLEAEKKAKAAFQPGKMAPDVAVPNVDGTDTVRLSDLRGNVVLLDFWASWCKPCRMENPNVVRNYNHYKDDGFTVFSVSLDKANQKDRWIQAIEQDGLIWPHHGSDLKGWQSAPVLTYQVKGIPFTVLIDKEGKIIDTNIRGPKLENHLKTIFGH